MRYPITRPPTIMLTETDEIYGSFASQRDREFEMGYLNSVVLGYSPGAVRVGSNATGLLFLPRSHPWSVSSIRCCATHPPDHGFIVAAATMLLGGGR